MKDTIISYDLENISSEGTEAIVTYKIELRPKQQLIFMVKQGKSL